jgi:hypothetical protein
MGGKGALTKFARDGMRERDVFEGSGITSEGTADSASDTSVGDVGNGGTSSKDI